MRVDLTAVLSLFSGLFTVALGLYLAMARYAIANREREIDRRIDDIRALADAKLGALEREVHTLQERLHNEEKATIRQDGDVNLVRQGHNDIKSDMDEVKRTLNEILRELRSGPERYSSQSTMGAAMGGQRKDPIK